MMKRLALCASLVVGLAGLGGLSATTANAAVTWTVQTVTSDSSPLTAVTPGATVTISITLRSDGAQTFGIGASAYGHDASILNFTSGTTSSAALVQFPQGPGMGFGGLDSTYVVQQVTGGTNAQVRFFNGLSITGTAQTGELDVSPITMAAAGPQFQVVFTAGTPGPTTVTIGAGANGDGVVGTGGAFLVSNEAVIPITVPEPAAIASSLAALGSVFAVVGIRRRR